MPLLQEQLAEIVSELVTRPGHEKVRSLVYRLLVEGLGAESAQISFEHPLPEVRGRVDALLGRTVLEFKRDLRLETADAEGELVRYLGDREQQTGASFVGIATDGALFRVYQLRHRQLLLLSTFAPQAQFPRALLAWLDGVVAVSAELPPEPDTIRRELGRESTAFAVASGQLASLWAEVADRPEVQLKRSLWASLLERVYGASVDDDRLFFQHTYLTVVAKTMAIRVLGQALPEPLDLVTGRPFAQASISGAVESDFFDWVLQAAQGANLVSRIAQQTARFRLGSVQHDVLKGLYESLIDPDQRHLLGEYYTPDWLASRMCDTAIARPLEQRVLDPSCGSGTFLFHAVRRFLHAADSAGLSNRQALERCCGHVLGVDIHPVAALIARVTYLLALGTARLTSERGPLSIPVYLGDSLQWNTRGLLAEREVLIQVPDGPALHFPASVAGDPAQFDSVVQTMLEQGEQGDTAANFRAWLDRNEIGNADDRDVLERTYAALAVLRAERRNHIWGYVARNLGRPIWLSAASQRADIVIGNPPWLPYRDMSAALQTAFRAACIERGLWTGGEVATQQDLSAYFFARCAELYVKPSGTIAFVMPYAALNRRQFEGLRTGWFGQRNGRRPPPARATVRFNEAWAFDESVRPLFPVPASVLVATADLPGPLPVTVTACSGTLPRRDAPRAVADAILRCREEPWPTSSAGGDESAYGRAFRNGATIFPRVLCVVRLAQAGGLGTAQEAPLVVSRQSPQEKKPWKELPRLEGTVEAAFLRPLYLGESVLPFRTLAPLLAVIPWDTTTGQLLDAARARAAGYRNLGRWLGRVEELWMAHSGGSMGFIENLDYYGKLTAQFPLSPRRVVYAASGTLPAAAIAREPAIIEHSLYWAAPASDSEAHYLSAFLNSEEARRRIERLQARGQWGARHFDKVMLSLQFPVYDAANPFHQDLAAAATRAERVAATVDVTGKYFVTARRLIRAALKGDGVADEMDRLITGLLD